MFVINPSCPAAAQVAEKTDLARIVTKAKVFKLVTEGNACVGCVYEKGGQNFQEFGPVILASGGVVFGHILWPFQNFKFRDFKISRIRFSNQPLSSSGSWFAGGFGADFTSNSLLAQYRPDLLHLPTTNGEHCTGDGIKMGEAGAEDRCNKTPISWRQILSDSQT